MEEQSIQCAGTRVPAVTPVSVNSSTKTAKAQRNRYVSIRLRVDPPTARWLRALARANAGHLEVRERGVAAILEQAAFCLADCAGRRTGSWEAQVARELLTSSGFVSEAGWRDIARLQEADRRDRRAEVPSDANTDAR